MVFGMDTAEEGEAKRKVKQDRDELDVFLLSGLRIAGEVLTLISQHRGRCVI